MARQPVQILVLPFRRIAQDQFEYLVLKRTEQKFWQGISGGVESGETVEQAAQREAFEEAGIAKNSPLFKLKTFSSLPVYLFKASQDRWPKDTLVIPEHYFAIDASGQEISLSEEHSEYRWCSFEEAAQLMQFDANKTGLWELQQRLMYGHLE